MKKRRTQRELAQSFLGERGILRLLELREAGVTAATMGRMVRAGEVIRLSRGVYQLSDAPLDPNLQSRGGRQAGAKGGRLSRLGPGVSWSDGSTARQSLDGDRGEGWAPQCVGTPRCMLAISPPVIHWGQVN